VRKLVHLASFVLSTQWKQKVFGIPKFLATFCCQCVGSGATFSKLLRKILGRDSYLIDDLGKTAILKTS